MSKLTITDDAGNSADMTLPDNVTLTVIPPPDPAQNPTDPADPSGPEDPNQPSPPPLAAGFIATLNADGYTVTFKDTSTSAVKTQWSWGDGGAVNTTPGDQVHGYRTAKTYTATQHVWDANGKHAVTTQQVTTTTDKPTTAPPSGGSSGGSAPPPSGGYVPPAPPAPPTAAGAHAVEIDYTDAADGSAWSVTAHVGEDWTVDGQYCAVYATDGTAHPGIRCRIYSDGVDVGAVIGSNTHDYAGTLTVKYDGATVFSEPVQLYRGTMPKTLRYGPQAPWKPVDLSLFPNWATPDAPLPIMDLSQFDLSFNGLGVASTPKMGDTGARADIAFVPEWDVPFCLQPSDAAFAVVRAAADKSGVWNIYFIDDATGLPYDITQYPNTSLIPYSQAKYAGNPIADYGVPNKISGNSMCTWSEAHQTAYNFVAAAATGSARDKWHAAVHANAMLIAFNPLTRQKYGFWKGYQQRGIGWGLRSVFLASFVSCLPDYFAAQLETMRTLAPMDNPLGFMAATMRPGSNGAYSGIAMFEENYGRITMDVIAHKLPAWLPYHQYLSKGAVTVMGGNTYPFATNYVLTIKDAAGNALPDWTSVLQATLRGPKGDGTAGAWPEADIAAFTAPDVTADTVDALLRKNTGYANPKGDFLGYVTSGDAYPAELRAACAGAVNAGIDGAADAWAKCQAVPTKPDYTGKWGFNIVPRAA